MARAKNDSMCISYNIQIYIRACTTIDDYDDHVRIQRGGGGAGGLDPP